MRPDTLRRRLLWLPALVVILSACFSPAAETAPSGILEPTSRPPATAEPTATAPSATTGTASGADIIFHNGVLLTMDGAQPTASAIHIQGERIVSVGDEASILAEAGPSTVVVDLQGLTLMPGIIDAHTHLFRYSANAGTDWIGAQEIMLGYGVTSAGDLSIDEPLLLGLRDLARTGDLRMRLSLYLAPYNDGCGNVLDETWHRSYAPGEELGPNVRLGGIKIYTDGGGCNAPAVSFAYANAGHGDLYFSEAELTDVVSRFQGEGYSLALHAIGDRAIEQVLDVLIATAPGRPAGVRHRLEHNAVIRPDLMPRYTQADAVGVLFGGFPTCFVTQRQGNFQYTTPQEYWSWEWPWRELLDANPDGHFAYHSDAFGNHSPNPFDHVFGMVTRQQAADDGTICQPPPDLARGAITVEQALELMTIGGAYALGQEDAVGSLEAGKYADLIVLSADPRGVAPFDLRNVQVSMTMVGGNVEYCAEGMDALCPSAPTAVPTAEATSAGFRDDFDSASLAESWSWIRENPSGWSLTERPGRLRLSTGDFSLLRAGGDAPLLVHPAPDGDFEILTRLDFAPNANFHFAGLLVYQDDDHFVALGRAFCGVVPPCVGDGVYLDNDEAFLAGDATTIAQAGLPQGEPVWLRLVRQGTNYTGSWSSDGETWTPVGSTMANFIPTDVGLMAATSASSAPPAPAEFDLFEMTSP